VIAVAVAAGVVAIISLFHQTAPRVDKRAAIKALNFALAFLPGPGVQLYDSTPGAPASAAQAASLTTLLNGRWTAFGSVYSTHGGGGLTRGEEVQQPWVFRRRCGHTGCNVYWTRALDGRALTARMWIGGDHASARFTERVTCASGNTKASGRLVSSFVVGFYPATQALKATEVTVATPPACAALDREILWGVQPMN
jgi:hypothetical protein